MPKIPAYLRPEQRPLAAPDAVVEVGHARFTVLTARLLRLEYAPDGRFEDRASQVFWFRRQPVPPFTVKQSGATTEIETEYLHLRYEATADGFTADTLSIALPQSGIAWRYGDANPGNLRGTARTLDEVSGSTHLAPGLLSRDGWTVVDDSRTLVFNSEGWVEPRAAAPGALDLYFFGYGRAFHECLRDYQKIAGKAPLLPRWALGNWWSRYWAYTHEELAQLMRDFRAHDVPLSVCIIDMDWHLVDIGREYEDLIGHGTGWTGYTWNQEFFPEPEKFIAWLHRQGLRTALNLHPADGVRPHEDVYPEMARRMNIDPTTEQPVLFDIANPDFAVPYFELLHHSQEARGVDFWWLDWQQGTESSLPGLDPLWWLNHLHFYDLGRSERKRPFIFSRWGGLGNHRYPIGFSGDTYVNWETLAFQPYFTATAANVAYGWWSHDIGGHMKGVEEPELYARWVQFGVFSPIMRLHSGKNPFHERRPWAHGVEAFHAARDAMQLRHALIPYLYTVSWLNDTEGTAPVRPMYHDYPERTAAYHCPQQYAFGSELIVAPFTAPADDHTRLSRQVVWLPPGEWYDFFSGEHFAGDGWHAIYGDLSRVPVFARAGAIVPLGPKVGWGGVGNPSTLDVHVFAGADSRFVLYEDDGKTQAYEQGDFGLTAFVQAWHGEKLVFTISAAVGETDHIPDERSYRLHIHGIHSPAAVALHVGRREYVCECTYEAEKETLHVTGVRLAKEDTLRLTLTASGNTLRSRRDRIVSTGMAMLHAFRLETTAKAALAAHLAELPARPELLAPFGVDLHAAQARALLEVTQQAGVHVVQQMGARHRVLLWNNREQPGMRYRFSALKPQVWRHKERFAAEMGVVPRFQAITREDDAWQLTADYFGLAHVVYDPGRD